MPTSFSEPVTSGSSISLSPRISFALPMTRLSIRDLVAAARQSYRRGAPRTRRFGCRGPMSLGMEFDPHPQLAGALQPVAKGRQGHRLHVVPVVAVVFLGVPVAVDDVPGGIQPFDPQAGLPVSRRVVGELELNLHAG